ncbi:MAG TPA: c-type cytochrome domain-containing protein [Acidobacteriaceae bacterium]|nr:c-type cytochrome domain-containing protein [Acidobacteriaceae bacterium]
MGEARSSIAGISKRQASLAGGTAAALLLLALVVPMDGHTPGGWQALVGRLHPLMVHLPIGLLVALPLLEFVGRRKAGRGSELGDAAGFLLTLAAACSVAAVLLGLLLAHGGGFTRAAVRGHMWGGVWVAVAALGCVLLRPLWVAGKTAAYPWVLGGTVLLLAWASHQGGSLVYGPNYLTEYLPQPARRWLVKVEPKPLVAGSVFAAKIYPVLDAKCVSCHGASKTEGGLRLDAYEYLMAGGRDGVVIVSGRPETSLLLQRVTLPTTDKKFMPAQGKPALTAEEVAVVRAWIAAGASATAADSGGAGSGRIEAPPQPVGDYSGLTAQRAALEMALHVRLTPVSLHASDGLILRTIDAGRTFNDAALGQLAPFAPYIVDAELGQSGVTDASFTALAKFPHLRALHLEGTAVTGRGIEALKGLRELRYINLTDTQATREAVETLKTIPQVEHVYLYNTPAQAMAH